MHKTAKQTADTLFKALAGLMAYNTFIDKTIKNVRKKKQAQKMRPVFYDYVSVATKSAGFIKEMGLDKKYDEYCKAVDRELAKKALENAG